MGSWTKVFCTCCLSPSVEPLVAIELEEAINLEMKRWLMSRIEAQKKDGGAQLLVHPGEDDDSALILVSATPCTLLRAVEVLGLARPYHNGSMMVFSYEDRASFKQAENIQKFLTLAERQYLVTRELESLKTQDETFIPGYPKEKLYQGECIFQSLQKRGFLLKFYPLHNKEELDALAKKWYSQTHFAPQPLGSIHAYFGDTIALYFSFLQFFTFSLVPMAVLGALMYLLSWDSVEKYLLFAVFNVVWSTATLEFWKRRSAAAAYGWGTLLLKSQFEEPRGNYWGPMGVNPITKRREPYYPSWKRKLRICLVSGPIVCVFLGIVILGIGTYLWMEEWVQDYHGRNDTLLSLLVLYMPCFIHTIYICLMNSVYKTIAYALTEWVFKPFASFNFVNCFAAMFYITFCLKDMQLLRKRLVSLLVVSQMINQFTESLLPYLLNKLSFQGGTAGKKDHQDEPTIDRIKSEGDIPTFPGMFDDYMELFVQFGYVSLFSCVFPLTAALLVLNNVIEIRTDALKLCRLYQKPFSSPAANIGVWQIAFEMLGFLSVVTNCFLIGIAPEVTEVSASHGVTSFQLLLFTIVVEHALLVLKTVIAFVIPDEPDWVKLKVAQIEYRSLNALKRKVAVREEDVMPSDSREGEKNHMKTAGVPVGP
nr:PREDICTED: anoctamin-10-like [Latimeria chalumnae]|eukprot:XP_014353638.1 PREDICTED: anoctamin-10-like [Latimeria chalumnae]